VVKDKNASLDMKVSQILREWIQLRGVITLADAAQVIQLEKIVILKVLAIRNASKEEINLAMMKIFVTMGTSELNAAKGSASYPNTPLARRKKSRRKKNRRKKSQKK